MQAFQPIRKVAMPDALSLCRFEQICASSMARLRLASLTFGLNATVVSIILPKTGGSAILGFF